MFLLPRDDGSYMLCPPNQCDWTFSMKKVGDDKWKVSGYKDDVLSYNGPETYNRTYVKSSDGWAVCDE